MQQCRKDSNLTSIPIRLSYGTSLQTVGSVAHCTRVFDAFDALVFIRESEPIELLTDLAKDDKASVYLNLKPSAIDSVLKSGLLEMSVQGARADSLATGLPPVVYVRIFAHDRQKRLLRYESFRLIDTVKPIQVRLPPKTKTVSIWIVARRIKSFGIEQVTVSGHRVLNSEFLLVQANEPVPKWVLKTEAEVGFTIISH